MRRAPVRWTVFVLTLTILAFSVGARASDMTRPTILGTEHMVACGHWLAAYTGNRILDMGGNAFDAGVAMVLAQSVLEFNLFGFGGEAPTLIYVADEGEVYPSTETWHLLRAWTSTGSSRTISLPSLETVSFLQVFRRCWMR